MSSCAATVSYDLHEPLQVRGEVFISKPDFEAANEARRSQGLIEFANPRNAASGSLRLIHLQGPGDDRRPLSFLAYHAVVLRPRGGPIPLSSSGDSSGDGAAAGLASAGEGKDVAGELQLSAAGVSELAAAGLPSSHSGMLRLLASLSFPTNPDNLLCDTFEAAVEAARCGALARAVQTGPLGRGPDRKRAGIGEPCAGAGWLDALTCPTRPMGP